MTDSTDILNSDRPLPVTSTILCSHCLEPATSSWPHPSDRPLPYCPIHLETEKQRLRVALGLANAL